MRLGSRRQHERKNDLRSQVVLSRALDQGSHSILIRSPHTYARSRTATLLSEAEQARALQIERLFDKSLKYKVEWEEELGRREKLGITGPQPIPHPDDIQVNFVTGEVRFTGPMTRRERAELDHWYDRVEEADGKIERLTTQLEKIRIRWLRADVEAQIAGEQLIRETIVSKIGEPSKRRRS